MDILPDRQRHPDVPPPSPPTTRRALREAAAAGRAGRDLPKAVGVGVGLGVVVVGALLVRKEAFVVLVAVAVVLALAELTQALRSRRLQVPLVPVLVGSLGILVSAYAAGAEALFAAFALTALGVLVWRVADGAHGAAGDVAAGVFAVAYVPFLAAFALLMLAEPDGPRRVVAFVLVTIASDIGGYAVGASWGRHPMAPSVSPRKSWEGLAGSVLSCLLVAVVSVVLLLDAEWWVGTLVGIAVVATATLGDLSESLLKRDLGIKDMGSLLPGHGGVLDRLDSLLLSAPVVYLLLAALVPAAA